MKEKGTSSYTSVYLDEESREKLRDLATQTGKSRSQVIRSLINGADGERERRLVDLVSEMKKVLSSK